jgi:hypothetical protein
MLWRRLMCLGFAAMLAALVSGCGSASSIETGIPANAELPPDFDPGGDATPDMKGTTSKKR